MTTNVQKFATDKEARAYLKAQLADYLAQAPESTRSAHMWMKRVDTAGLGIVIAAFGVALYGSFTWASVNPAMIPVAWFFFATCCSLMIVLTGLHAILIRAYPPVILPGKAQKFVSGSNGGVDRRGLHRGRLDLGRSLDRVRLFHRDLQPGDDCPAHEHSRRRHEYYDRRVHHLFHLSEDQPIPLNL
jgi:hypothetical protein